MDVKKVCFFSWEIVIFINNSQNEAQNEAFDRIAVIVFHMAYHMAETYM